MEGLRGWREGQRTGTVADIATVGLVLAGGIAYATVADSDKVFTASMNTINGEGGPE
jgi:hypothetical protein